MDKKDLKEIKGVVKEVVNKEIDKFAVVVAKGFGDIDRKLIEHDKKFESIDKKFENVDNKFDSIDNKFDSIDKKFDSIDNRFDSIDNRFDSIDNRFEKIENKLDYQNQKMDYGFNELSTKIDKVVAMLTQDMVPAYKDIANLKQRVTKLEKATA